ncbi:MULTISPECIES: oligosaccharide flippase family protein [unclassified Shewanella]|uniref:oligosaccharide flippase family protein n=1 Tax=unclassified Shewanella TaxID=196818 RepID=UPI0039B5ED61
MSSFKRNVLTLFSGTLLAQGIPIALSPVLTRLYSPTEFGVLAVYLAVISLLSIIFTGRYELAILLGKNESNAKSIYCGAMYLSILSFFAILSFFSYFNYEIAKMLNVSEVVVYIIPFGALLIAIYQLTYYYLNRQSLYKSMSIAKVAQSTSAVSGQLSLNYFTAYGLIWGEVIGRLVGVGYQLTKVLPLFKYSSNSISYKKMLTQLRIRKDHPKFLMSTALLETGSNHALPIVLSSFFGVTLLGYYSLATRTLSAPMALIGASVGQVFFKEFSVMSSSRERSKLLLLVWSKLFLLGLVPFSILFTFGEELFSIVFGDQWSMAGAIASSLTPMLFIMFVSSPTSSCYIVLGMNNLLIRFGIITLSYRLISLLIGFYFDDFYLVLNLLVICEVSKILVFNFIALNKLKSKDVR